MTNDEFIREFDAYAERKAARRGRCIFQLGSEELNDAYCPGETENPALMPLEAVQHWLIRRSISSFESDIDTARNWFFSPNELLHALPIDLIHTHIGVVSVFRALPVKRRSKLEVLSR